jgi:ABC-type molybdate transport system ATPase subunit
MTQIVYASRLNFSDRKTIINTLSGQITRPQKRYSRQRVKLALDQIKKELAAETNEKFREELALAGQQLNLTMIRNG